MLQIALKIAFALFVPTLLAVAIDYLLRRDDRSHTDEPSPHRGKTEDR